MQIETTREHAGSGAKQHQEAKCRHWGVQTHTEGYADTEGCKYTKREDI